MGEPPRHDTVEVLPDVTGLDRTFHYDASGLARPVPVGAVVRVLLHGRRVRGWVVGADTPVPAGIELHPVLELVSAGPPPEVVDLCRWVAWRFAGRLRAPLLAASPERVVRVGAGAAGAGFGAGAGAGEGWPGEGRPDPEVSPSPPIERALRDALATSAAVLRIPPAEPRLPVVEAALALGPPGPALVLCESRSDVERLAGGLRERGWSVAVHPDEWGRIARVTIGTRNAAFSPHPFSLALALDAHSEAYRAERVPTFDARVVVAERARRLGSPALFVTPCPTVELIGTTGRTPVALLPQAERDGWGRIGVLDVREEDPAEGGYPSRLVAWIREAAEAEPGRPVVCLVNRSGRARLLRCGMCRNLQRCPRCGAAQAQLERPARGEIGVLTCPRCEAEEPAICPACGSARLQIARAGVSRAREQLEAVTGLAVGEVSGPRAAVPPTPVLVGTQAVLYRVRSASMVVWLDFDQELLAARFRAGEEALAFLARSVRLVGGRRRAGRVVLRTSLPDHEVVRAAQLGDPGLVESAERERRLLLALPPYAALARIDGPGAASVVEALSALAPSVSVLPAGEERYVVRAASVAELADGLQAVVAATAGGYAALDARIEMEPIDL